MNKSFFKDEDAFVKFAQQTKEVRARILKGEHIDPTEVGGILDEVKEVGKDASKRSNKSKKRKAKNTL